MHGLRVQKLRDLFVERPSVQTPSLSWPAAVPGYYYLLLEISTWDCYRKAGAEPEGGGSMPGVSVGERAVGWCCEATQPPLGRSCFEVHQLSSAPGRCHLQPVWLVSKSASRYKMLFQRNRLNFLKYLPATLEGGCIQGWCLFSFLTANLHLSKNSVLRELHGTIQLTC